MFRWEDFIVVGLVALFLFGPNKLVDFAKGLGTAMREFKKAANPEDNTQNSVSAPAQAALPTPSKPADSNKNGSVIS